jgi:hypothetical protein
VISARARPLIRCELRGLQGARGRAARPSILRRRRRRSAWSSRIGRRRRRRCLGTLVSSRFSAPAVEPVRMNPSAARATVSSSHSVHGCAPRKQKRKENGRRSPLLRVTARADRRLRGGRRSRCGRGQRRRSARARGRGSPTSSRAGLRVGGARSRAPLRERARRRLVRQSCRRRRLPRARRRTAAPLGARRRRRRSDPSYSVRPSSGSRRYSAPVAKVARRALRSRAPLRAARGAVSPGWSAIAR